MLPAHDGAAVAALRLRTRDCGFANSDCAGLYAATVKNAAGIPHNAPRSRAALLLRAAANTLPAHNCRSTESGVCLAFRQASVHAIAARIRGAEADRRGSRRPDSKSPLADSRHCAHHKIAPPASPARHAAPLLKHRSTERRFAARGAPALAQSSAGARWRRRSAQDWAHWANARRIGGTPLFLSAPAIIRLSSAATACNYSCSKCSLLEVHCLLRSLLIVPAVHLCI